MVGVIIVVVNDELTHVGYETIPGFHFEVPKTVPHVNSAVLNPRRLWKDKNAYDRYAQLLMEKFVDNFKKFKMDGKLLKAGPQLS